MKQIKEYFGSENVWSFIITTMFAIILGLLSLVYSAQNTKIEKNTVRIELLETRSADADKLFIENKIKLEYIIKAVDETRNDLKEIRSILHTR